MAEPYLLFALGWGTRLEWVRAWASHLAPSLAERGLLPSGAREGRDYDVFDWGRPNCFVSSMLRPTGSAAAALSARLPPRDDVVLIGHSKAGNLVLEYLARVAEGRLPAHPGLRRAVVLNAPIDNLAARTALAWIDPARLRDLEPRLSARGVPARVQVVYDPTDPVSRPIQLDGLTCLAHPSGSPCGRLPIGSLQFWHRNHMACFRDGWADLLRAL